LLARNWVYGNEMTSEEEEEADSSDNGNISIAME